MTTQEIFDKAVQHFIAQPTRCTSPKEGRPPVCAYYNTEHQRCVVGGLLTEESAMRAQAISDVPGTCGAISVIFSHADGPLKEELIQLGCYDKETMELLGMLQSCHDTSTSPTMLIKRLQIVADYYRLSASAIDGITEWEGIRLTSATEPSAQELVAAQ